MKIVKFSFLLLVGFFFAGCASHDFVSHNYQAPMARTASIATGKGYLYGRFKLDSELLLAPRLALEVQNEKSDAHFSIRFRPTDDVAAIEILPGEYRVTNLILAKIGPNLESVSDYECIPLSFTNEFKELAESFTVQAGKAYYLGDYYGVVRKNRGAMPSYVLFYGGVTKIYLKFDETTVELKNLYPQFNQIETRPCWKRD